MITKEIACSLAYRDTLYHVEKKDSRGFPVVCRVNGKCKTWKTRPEEFCLPVKYGLRGCFHLTHSNCMDWSASLGKEENKDTLNDVA